MKYQFFTLLLSVICIVNANAQKKDEVNFTDAFQLDSTEYFMIPKLISGDNEAAYGKGKGYLPYGNYSEINLYNAATGTVKKVFNGQLAIITPFFTRRFFSYQDPEPAAAAMPVNILPGHIIYLARTENFNDDNGLDTEDPIYLYISTRTGENLKQITPKGLHVLSWTVSKDKKMILVRVMNDKSGNKKFGNGDDELYYRVDLNEDISLIKCYQVNL